MNNYNAILRTTNETGLIHVYILLAVIPGIARTPLPFTPPHRASQHRALNLFALHTIPLSAIYHHKNAPNHSEPSGSLENRRVDMSAQWIFANR